MAWQRYFKSRQAAANMLKTAGYVSVRPEWAIEPFGWATGVGLVGPDGTRTERFEHWRRSHPYYCLLTEDGRGTISVVRHSKAVEKSNGHKVR